MPCNTGTALVQIYWHTCKIHCDCDIPVRVCVSGGVGVSVVIRHG